MEHYYLPFLSLFLYIITLICSSTASYKWSKVLVILYKQRSNKIQTSLSPLFNLYSAICFCYNFLLIFHCLYMVIAWRIENDYNAYFIFWSFIPAFAFIIIDPIVVLFMTIDRCLMIKCPMLYLTSKFERLLFRITLCFMTIVLVINHACHFLAYPELAETTCWSPGCIFSYRAKVVYPIVKFGTAFLIIVASSYFFYLLRNFNRSEILLHPDVHKRKIGNFLVKYIIFMEFSFNFVPFLLWSIISNIFVFPLAKYLGPLLICLNSIDGCCCAFMFSAKLTKVKTNTISVN